ncbi:MAG: NRDE family protein [Planctomycetota bacterium]|nr:NRDE family protein [Planctomycetota bacterium]
MCTVTLLRSEAGLVLTMNRDELIERDEEEPPRIRTLENGLNWLGPLDPPSTGTWFGVNEKGVAACLLNRYVEREHEPDEPQSRGALPLLALSRGNLSDAWEFVEKDLDLSAYRPFSLILISVAQTVVLAWEGDTIDVSASGEKTFHYTSSSWKREDVLAWRQKMFEHWVENGCKFTGKLPNHNILCPKGKEAWAPLMRRSYARTRSICQARIAADRSEVNVHYWPDTDRHAIDCNVSSSMELTW